MAGSIWAGMGPTWRDPQEITGEAYREGALTGAGFAQAFSSAFDKAAERNSLQGQLQMKQVQTGLDMDNVKLESAHLALDNQREQAEQWRRFAPAVMKWRGLTSAERLNTPPPDTGSSEEASSLVSKTQQQDQQEAYRQSQDSDHKLMMGRVTALKSEQARSEMYQMLSDPKTGRQMSGPPTTVQWQHLAELELGEKLAAAPEMTDQEKMAAGWKKKEVEGPKGKTVTWESPAAGGSAPGEIEFAQLPDGRTAYRTKGSRASFRPLQNQKLSAEIRVAYSKLHDAGQEMKNTVTKPDDDPARKRAVKDMSDAEANFKALWKSESGSGGVEADAPAATSATAAPEAQASPGGASQKIGRFLWLNPRTE